MDTEGIKEYIYMMHSDTIWSNENSSPLQGTSGMKYQSVLDLVDSEVAKMLSASMTGSLPSLDTGLGRRFSLNDGSDIDGDLFGIKKGALSAITAPVGSNSRPQLYGGTASVSAGVANRHPHPDSFLQKFASVAEATRDLELSNNLARMSLDSNTSRKTSTVNNEQASGLKPINESGFFGSQQNSLNENLNIPMARSSRHQSISEKIDNYNNNSPIQASATLSVNSDVNVNNPEPATENRQHHVPHSFWNPATATPFTPTSSYNYFMDNNSNQGSVLQYNQQTKNSQTNGTVPLNVAPYSGPAPPANIMDLGFYNFAAYPPNVPETNENRNISEEIHSVNEGVATSKERPREKNKNLMTPGVGLINRSVGSTPVFMFQPFQPYGSFHTSPSPVHSSLQNSHGDTSDSNVSVSSNFQKRKGNSRSNAPGKGGNHIYRSPLLEEVRSNLRTKEYVLKDIYGHAVEFTRDQHGSRFIQQKLPDASEEEKEVIFNEIREISQELMTDVFGNYVIQKFFEFGTPTQKRVLLDSMKGQVYKLSLQMYGCRVVQRALESLELESQIKIIEELKEYVLICSKDQNGNHVIQKSIERIPFEHIRFVLDALDNQIYHLSTHPYGCRVIQRLLEYSTVEDQRDILNELNRFIFYLIQDQYGNYVMQHTLERGNPEDREEILNVVLGSVVNFSKHKFASNVIEKCIKFGNFEQRKKILHEVMIGNEDYNVSMVDDDSPLALMMKDQYANYVIQKLVEGFDTKSEEKRLLVLKLRQYLKQISSKNTYGKHLASVEKMIIVAETALIEAENS